MAVAGGFESQLIRFPAIRFLQSRFATDQVQVGRYRLNRAVLRRAAFTIPTQHISKSPVEIQSAKESAAATDATGTTESKDIEKVEKTPEAEKQTNRPSTVSQGRGSNLISSLLEDRQHGRLQGENPLVNDRKDQRDGDDEGKNPKVEENKTADGDDKGQPQTLEQLRKRRAELESQHQANEHTESELNKAADVGPVDEDEMGSLSEEREQLQDQLREVDQKILEKLKEQYAQRNDELNRWAQEILTEEFGECSRKIMPQELRKLGETNAEFQTLVQAVNELEELAKEIASLESQNPVNGTDVEGKKQEEPAEQEEQEKPFLSFVQRRAIARCLKIDLEDVDELLRDGELDLDGPFVGQRRLGLGILDFFPRKDRRKGKGTLQIFFPPAENNGENESAKEDSHDDSEANDTDDKDNHQKDSESKTQKSGEQRDKQSNQGDKDEQQNDKKEKQGDKGKEPKEDHRHSSDHHSSDRSNEPISPLIPQFSLEVESHLTDREYEDLQRAGERAKEASANHAAAIDRAAAAQQDSDHCEKELEDLRRQHDAAKEAVNAAEEALKKAEVALANYQADVDRAKRAADHADRQFWVYERYRSIVARRSGLWSGDYRWAQQQFNRGKREHGETGREFQHIKHSLADRQEAVEAAKAELEAAKAAEQAARDALESKEEECCTAQNKRQQADAEEDRAADEATQANQAVRETSDRIGQAVYKRMAAEHSANVARRAAEAEAAAEAERRKEAVPEQDDADDESDVDTEESQSGFGRKVDEILEKNGYDPDDPVIRDVVSRIHFVGHGGAEAFVDLGALVTVPLNASLGVAKSVWSYIIKLSVVDPFHDLLTTGFGLMVDHIFSHLDADTIGELVDHIFD